MLDDVLIFLLIAIIVYQQVLFHMERKDLYNRLMASDLTEYKSIGKKRPTIRNVIRKHAEQMYAEEE